MSTANAIGYVQQVLGDVFVIGADGKVRKLAVDSPIQDGEQIVSEHEGNELQIKYEAIAEPTHYEGIFRVAMDPSVYADGEPENSIADATALARWDSYQNNTEAGTGAASSSLEALGSGSQHAASIRGYVESELRGFEGAGSRATVASRLRYEMGNIRPEVEEVIIDPVAEELGETVETQLVYSGYLPEVNDPNPNDTHTYEVSTPVTYTVVNAEGPVATIVDNLTVTITDTLTGAYTVEGDFDHLAVGETATITFGYTATDDSRAGNARSVEGNVTLTVTGTNDAPVAVADVLSGEVTIETGTNFAKVLEFSSEESVIYTRFSVTEADTTVTISTGESSFDTYIYLLNDDGSISEDDIITSDDDGGPDYDSYISVVLQPGDYIVATSAFYFSPEEVVAGENLDVEEEGEGAFFDDATTTLTVESSNPISLIDESMVVGFDVIENGSVTIDVLANDTDLDNGATFTLDSVAAPEGKGTASIVDNQLLFDTGSDFDYLAEGETTNVTVTYTMSDEHGATSSATALVTVTGTNDAPVAVADVVGGDVVSETGTNIAILLEFSSDASVIYTSFSVTEADTTISISTGNSSFDTYIYLLNDDGSLGADDIITSNDDWYGLNSYISQVLQPGDYIVATSAFYFSSDEVVSGENSSTPESATTTLTFVSDKAITVITSGQMVYENDTVTIDVLANDIDVDNGAVLSLDSVAMAVGDGTVSIADNKLVFDPGSSFDYLAEGETAEVVVNYTMSDEYGASSSSTATITITGTNDQPVVSDVNVNPVSATLMASGATLTALESFSGVTIANSGSTPTDGSAMTFTLLTEADETVTFNWDFIDNEGGWDLFNDFSFVVIDGVLMTLEDVVDTDVSGNTLLSHLFTTAGEHTVTFGVMNSGDTVADSALNIAYVSGGTIIGTEMLGSVTLTNTLPELDGIATVYSGQLELTEDLDATDTHTFQLVTDSASVTTDSTATITDLAVTVAADGSYSVSGNFDELAAGETATVTFEYTATDDSGAANATSEAKTVTLTVTGTNDAPEVVAYEDFAATEDAAAVTGQVVATDVDVDDDSTTLVYSLVGDAPAGLTFNADGSYSFDPSDAAYQSLAEGETTTVSFSWKATDSHGAETTTDTVAIVITGTNDAPEAVAQEDFSATEDGTVVSGNVTATDIDSDDDSTTLVYTLVGDVPAGLTFNADGSYSFDPSDAAYQSLAEGETTTVSFSWKATDSHGADSSVDTVDIVITGTNDQPVVSDVNVNELEAVTVIEAFSSSGPTTDLTIKVNGLDVTTTNQSGYYYANTYSGAYGATGYALEIQFATADAVVTFPYEVESFSFNAGAVNGNTEYIEILYTDGTTETVLVADTSSSTYDGFPHTRLVSATAPEGKLISGFTILDGVDWWLLDTISYTASNVISETDGIATVYTGQLELTEDLDLTDTHTFQLVTDSAAVTTEGTATITDLTVTVAADGSYSVSGNFDELAVGETATVTFEYTATDDSGAANATSEAKTVTLTVTGTNDAPVAQDVTIDPATAKAVEGDPEAAVTLTGTFDADDVDSDNTAEDLTYSIVTAPAAGSVTISGNQFTFDPGADFQELAAGETTTVSFTYKATDAHGADSETKTVVLTVEGTNDAPEIVAHSDLSATEDGAVVTGNVTATDIDSDDDSTTLTYTLVGDAPAGLSFNADGSYSFDPSDAAYQSLAEGETTTVSFSWKATDSHGADSSVDTVDIVITGTNDQPVVSDVNANGEPSVIGLDTFSAAIYQSSGHNSFGEAFIATEDTLSKIEFNLFDTADGTASTYTATISDSFGNVIYSENRSTSDGDSGLVTFDNLNLSLVVGETYKFLVTETSGNIDTSWGYGDATDGGSGIFSDSVMSQYDAGIRLTYGGGEEVVFETNGIATVYSGQLELTEDLDATDTHTFQLVTDSASVTTDSTATITDLAVTVAADGSYSVSGNFDELAAGETATVTFEYTATDDSGAANATSEAKTVTLTVTGTNDAPVAQDVTIDPATAKAVEGDPEAAVTLTGTFDADDVDSDNTAEDLTYSIVTAPAAGSVTISGNQFTFDPGADFQELAAGETTTVSFTYKATDVHGADSETKTVLLTVEGTNDAPQVVAHEDVNVTEGTGVVAGQVIATDVDSDDDSTTLTYSLVGDAPVGLSFNADGSYSFDTDHADYNALAGGETATVSFTWYATDSHGAVSAASDTVLITVTGSDDAPVATLQQVDTGRVEDSGSHTVTVLATLPKVLAALTIDEATGDIYAASREQTSTLYKITADGDVSVVSTNFTLNGSGGTFFPFLYTDIGFHDNHVYTVSNSGRLVEVDVLTGTSRILHIFSGFVNESGLDITPEGKILVTDGNGVANALWEYDINTGTVTNLSLANVPAYAYGLEYDDATGEIYVQEFNTNSLKVVDDVTNTVISATTGVTPDYDVLPGGEAVYYKSGNTIYARDMDTGTTESVATVGSTYYQEMEFGDATDGNGESLYVLDGNMIKEIDGFDDVLDDVLQISDVDGGNIDLVALLDSVDGGAANSLDTIELSGHVELNVSFEDVIALTDADDRLVIASSDDVNDSLQLDSRFAIDAVQSAAVDGYSVYTATVDTQTATVVVEDTITII